MLNLEELAQLIAFKELRTLSKVAEKFLISTPSLSRSMQHLEEDFGVSLFDRSANRISLNKTGERAVEVARRILSTSQQGIKEVRQFDQSLKTITIASVAPAPLWSLLPFAYEQNQTTCLPYLQEDLAIAVTTGHDLARLESVSFEAINGYNFLLMDQIGFWNELVQEKMPASKFLIQSNRFEFEELAYNSTLPRFATNLSQEREKIQDDRVMIPISDPEAHVHYHLVSLNPEINLADLINV